MIHEQVELIGAAITLTADNGATVEIQLTVTDPGQDADGIAGEIIDAITRILEAREQAPADTDDFATRERINWGAGLDTSELFPDAVVQDFDPTLDYGAPSIYGGPQPRVLRDEAGAIVGICVCGECE